MTYCCAVWLVLLLGEEGVVGGEWLGLKLAEPTLCLLGFGWLPVGR